MQFDSTLTCEFQVSQEVEGGSESLKFTAQAWDLAIDSFLLLIDGACNGGDCRADRRCRG
jgi:hypothetical protein